MLIYNRNLSCYIDKFHRMKPVVDDAKVMWGGEVAEISVYRIANTGCPKRVPNMEISSTMHSERNEFKDLDTS